MRLKTGESEEYLKSDRTSINGHGGEQEIEGVKIEGEIQIGVEYLNEEIEEMNLDTKTPSHSQSKVVSEKQISPEAIVV